MIEDKKIAVIMPAYNEELLIEKSIDSVPNEVNKIIVINDLSKDQTKEIVENKIKSNQKIVLINNKKNYGVGYSIVEGYKKAYDLDCDIAVVMPGDAQALPEDFY